ncbi:MAG: hypothetical protein P4L71_13090, partial [Acetobacteraceae bacterium]|nr:hypothetical protein [Acetobacteraceae bacterium]
MSDARFSRRAALFVAAGTCAMLSATPSFAYYYEAGDLVVSIEGGNGATDNQAAPLTLEELRLNGSSPATVVGTVVLPQTTVTANGVTNYAVSGEYGSSSEGTLQLSGNGQYLSIMGYGVNAAAYNANPLSYGGSVAALGQSASADVPRVAALIGTNGSVDSTTALTNVFNTNNPRSVYTVDGSSFYVSGQGVKGDTTQGVFYAVKGATTATAIDTSTDTRDVQIVNGKLTVSRDFNGSGGAQATNISTLSGPGGTLPTSSTGVTTAQILPAGGSTGSITLTTSTANGVNNGRLGTTVYLSPENFFYASPTVLYVADSGAPKNGNAEKAALGDGGLQKWVLVNGTWTLE